MNASSPIRPPLAGSDPIPLLGRDTAGSGAAGMTAASGSADEMPRLRSLPDIIESAAASKVPWVDLERKFDGLTIQFSLMAFGCCAGVVFMPASAEDVFVCIVAAMFLFNLVFASLSAAESRYCRGWADEWQRLSDDAHALLAGSA